MAGFFIATQHGPSLISSASNLCGCTVGISPLTGLGSLPSLTTPLGNDRSRMANGCCRPPHSRASIFSTVLSASSRSNPRHRRRQCTGLSRVAGFGAGFPNGFAALHQSESSPDRTFSRDPVAKQISQMQHARSVHCGLSSLVRGMTILTQLEPPRFTNQVRHLLSAGSPWERSTTTSRSRRDAACGA